MNIEIEILNLIQRLRSPLLDWLMVKITSLGNVGAFWIFLIIVLVFFKKTKKFAYIALFSLLVTTLIVNVILKPLVNRPRPYTVNQSINIIIKKPKDASFPSGHTASSFAVAAALYLSDRKYRKNDEKVKGNYKERKYYKNIYLLGLVLASLIAFSRLYLYVHYPTDVLAGLLIGSLSAYAAVSFWGKRILK